MPRRNMPTVEEEATTSAGACAGEGACTSFFTPADDAVELTDDQLEAIRADPYFQQFAQALAAIIRDDMRRRPQGGEVAA